VEPENVCHLRIGTLFQKPFVMGTDVLGKDLEGVDQLAQVIVGIEYRMVAVILCRVCAKGGINGNNVAFIFQAAPRFGGAEGIKKELGVTLHQDKAAVVLLGFFTQPSVVD